MAAPTNTPATPPNFPDALLAFSKLKTNGESSPNNNNNNQQTKNSETQSCQR